MRSVCGQSLATRSWGLPSAEQIDGDAALVIQTVRIGKPQERWMAPVVRDPSASPAIEQECHHTGGPVRRSAPSMPVRGPVRGKQFGSAPLPGR